MKRIRSAMKENNFMLWKSLFSGQKMFGNLGKDWPLKCASCWNLGKKLTTILRVFRFRLSESSNDTENIFQVSGKPMCSTHFPHVHVFYYTLSDSFWRDKMEISRLIANSIRHSSWVNRLETSEFLSRPENFTIMQATRQRKSAIQR